MIDNVLFISIEDLNDWIEPLNGHPDTRTPNLTRLANKSVVFQNAYSPAPACSPARTAALFGSYPWTTGVYANEHKWHDFFGAGKRQSLIGRIKDAGWDTIGAGKVFHNKPQQFDHSDWTKYRNDRLDLFPPQSQSQRNWAIGSNTDWGPVPDDAFLYDERNANWMLNQITLGAKGKFWALGLYRPHLPFIVQQKYFDRFPAIVADPPGLGLNQFSAHNTLRQAPLGTVATQMADKSRRLRRALEQSGEYNSFVRSYLASVNYADELLGRVIDRLEECKLWDRTLIILWSDHGWQFGEKLAFRKFTLWERALRIPLMISGSAIQPKSCRAPVSLVDIAPTLFAKLDLDIPSQFEGQDLSPVLDNIGDLRRAYAPSVWGMGFHTGLPELSATIRSQDHRYILYHDGSEELYDHRIDPWEHSNLITGPAGFSDKVLDEIREQHLNMMPSNFCDPVQPQ